MESALPFDAARQRALVARGQAGDKSALAELYDLSFPVVYRWAMATTRNREEAEDITAETFERALRRIKRFESRDVPIIVWLMRIAQNVAREHRRKHGGHRVVGLGEDAVEAPHAPATGSTDLRMLIDSLSAAQREVLLLRLAGLKLREIAALRGSAEGTVKALQFSAMRNLRKAMRDEH